jgi:hypothetical protein
MMWVLIRLPNFTIDKGHRHTRTHNSIRNRDTAQQFEAKPNTHYWNGINATPQSKNRQLRRIYNTGYNHGYMDRLTFIDNCTWKVHTEGKTSPITAAYQIHETIYNRQLL